MEAMDTLTRPADEDRPDVEPEPSDAASPESGSVSRRALLRAAGGGLVAVGVSGVRARGGQPPDLDVPAGQHAAAPAAGQRLPSAIGRGLAIRLRGALRRRVAGDEPRTVGAPSASAPAMDHDANALAVVERFLGGEGASMANPGNVPSSRRSSTG
jgi:hypothetical protein